MRSEMEMLDLIQNFARADERIRAVILNGSRVNPKAPRDIFQDYDVVFLVSSVKAFVQDRNWIKTFGELIIMQTPDDMVIPSPSDGSPGYSFLMLFEDGNRIDLTLYPVPRIDELEPDSLSQVLLDKDGIVGQLEPPSNKDYLPQPPTAKQYADCCNEFWWVSTYIAKGLWREELPYAKFMYERPVRDMLDQMIRWYIGVQTDFSEDPGKCGKYFGKYLPGRHWDAYLQTYANGDYKNCWDALFTMCALFRDVAVEVGAHFNYNYPSGDDERVTTYLRHIRALPKEAQGIF